MFHDKYFTKEELKEKLEIFEQNKTFEEIDINNVFEQQEPAKGILGCVVEQSVLGMKQNSIQEADLEIKQENGEYKSTELKVTGVQFSNKRQDYEAKEPMSLTAVSIGTIEHETFLESHFYNKIAHMLWIFYIYEKRLNEKRIPYKEYKNFRTLGYKFIDIADDANEIEKFKNDWMLVRNYLIEANKSKNPEKLYPLLHQTIKDKLFYIDIAPRYKSKPKQTPRFRLKKTYVNSIFQDYWASREHKKYKTRKLLEDINSFNELECRLRKLEQNYRGMSVKELIECFGICYQGISQSGKIKEGRKEKVPPKQIMEMIAVNMFGGKFKRIGDIELFQKIGVIGKTIVITKNKKKTEDIKLFTINVGEFMDKQMTFENSSFYQYFNEHKILCIIYEEPSKEAGLCENKFLGFKWFTFSGGLIDKTIKEVYDIIRDRLLNHTLEERYVYKKDGTQRINATKIPMTTLNLPKAKEYDIFVKGTGGIDSSYKTWSLKGKAADKSNMIHLYSQQIWIKGDFIANELQSIDFI